MLKQTNKQTTLKKEIQKSKRTMFGRWNNQCKCPRAGETAVGLESSEPEDMWLEMRQDPYLVS